MIIMSSNQWKCDANNDAWRALGEDCSSDARSEGLIRAYTDVMPDVVGMQEVSEHMAELLTGAMKDVNGARYAYITGGDTPIMYRADKLTLMESGFLRYPESVPGLDGCFNNAGTKSYCWAVFEPVGGGKRFAFMSTHLWWMSSRPGAKNYYPRSNEARAWQISLACRTLDEIIGRYACPGVIVGDFNASIDSLCLDAARGDGWTDVYELASERDETSGHHYCFADGFRRGDLGTYREAIDHIIVKNLASPVKYFRRHNPEWFDKISDHYPLYTELEL